MACQATCVGLGANSQGASSAELGGVQAKAEGEPWVLNVMGTPGDLMRALVVSEGCSAATL